MLKSGDTIHNPSINKSYTFIKTTSDTNGEYLQLNCKIGPTTGGNPVLTHSHNKQTEIVTVVSGSMTAVVNGKKMRYQPGEMLVIKPGEAHRWWNANTRQELEVIMEVRPALQTQQFFETICSIARVPQNKGKSELNILHLAVMIKDYSDVYTISGPWAPLKKGIFNALAAWGRYKGYTSELVSQKWVTNPIK
jgi:mannose-6-phosphate isomerase-like protein (cupin superfamily)